MSLSRKCILLFTRQNNIIKIDCHTKIIRLFVLKHELAYRVFVCASHDVQRATRIQTHGMLPHH